MPKGRWVGGTIPYFITPENGGMVSQDKLFVTDISDDGFCIDIKIYTSIRISKDIYGFSRPYFSFIIIPMMSTVHSNFYINGYKIIKIWVSAFGWLDFRRTSR